MKIRRLSVSPVVLSFLVAVLSGLLWWAGTPARAAFAPTVALIPVSGTVSGQPESVRFSGQARVSSELVLDTSRTPPPPPPSVIPFIHPSGVSRTRASRQGRGARGGGGTPPVCERALTHTVPNPFPFPPGT